MCFHPFLQESAFNCQAISRNISSIDNLWAGRHHPQQHPISSQQSLQTRAHIFLLLQPMMASPLRNRIKITRLPIQTGQGPACLMPPEEAPERDVYPLPPPGTPEMPGVWAFHQSQETWSLIPMLALTSCGALRFVNPPSWDSISSDLILSNPVLMT